MLVQLLPEQISTYWPIVRYSIESSMPPTVLGAVDMNTILQNIMAGSIQVWASVSQEKVVAIITTTIVTDIGATTSDLLIYSLYGTGDIIGKENWKDGFDTLRKYALGKGCTRVTAYTQSDVIKKLAKWFGGDTSWTYIAVNAA
jgi:hypothetical protein